MYSKLSQRLISKIQKYMFLRFSLYFLLYIYYTCTHTQIHYLRILIYNFYLINFFSTFFHISFLFFLFIRFVYLMFLLFYEIIIIMLTTMRRRIFCRNIVRNNKIPYKRPYFFITPIKT